MESGVAMAPQCWLKNPRAPASLAGGTTIDRGHRPQRLAEVAREQRTHGVVEVEPVALRAGGDELMGSAKKFLQG